MSVSCFVALAVRRVVVSLRYVALMCGCGMVFAVCLLYGAIVLS